MQAVDKQSWDASVKALTEFPSVLDNMAKNLAWTSSLGEAYHNQQADVMTAIRTLRAQAKAKGNLQSSSQITVVQQSPQTIVIQPANPQIVYVPEYNPTLFTGRPIGGELNVVPYSNRKAGIYPFDFELCRALAGATEAAMDAGPDWTQCGNSAVSRIYVRKPGH